jgi:hypothetical protein
VLITMMARMTLGTDGRDGVKLKPEALAGIVHLMEDMGWQVYIEATGPEEWQVVFCREITKKEVVE